MSGRRSRDKGGRVERKIVHALQFQGFAAERVPLSGAVGGRFCGDVVLPLLADGWLEGRDALIVTADRREPLVVVRLSLAAEIAKQGIPMNAKGSNETGQARARDSYP